MGYELITPSTTDLDLISLDEAKVHIRVDEQIEDSYVTILITAAREHVEDYLQRTILEATWRYQIDFFPRDDSVIFLPRPRASSIAVFSYLDADGNLQSLTEGTDFRFHELINLKSAVEPEDTWPTTEKARNAVTIDFKAGWAVDKVPKKLRQAIMIVIADMYEARQSDVFGMSINATRAMEKLTSAWRVDQ